MKARIRDRGDEDGHGGHEGECPGETYHEVREDKLLPWVGAPVDRAGRDIGVVAEVGGRGRRQRPG